MKGHWFCHNCDEIVFLHAPASRAEAVKKPVCPVCHTVNLDWIPREVPLSPARQFCPERPASEEFRTRAFAELKAFVRDI